MNEILTLQLEALLAAQIQIMPTHWLQRLGHHRDAVASLCFYNRVPGRVMGLEAVQYLLPRIDPCIQCQTPLRDGTWVPSGSLLFQVQAPIAVFLLAEPWIRSLVETLSGITTGIAQWEEVLSPHGIRILYRQPPVVSAYSAWEREAALRGGARNHRLFLTEGVRLHDLHYQWMGSLTEAVSVLVEALPPTIKIETEVASLDQVQEAIEAGSHMLLLRDMTLAEVKLAIRTGQRRVWIEWMKPFDFPSDLPILLESGVQLVSTTSLLAVPPLWPLYVQVETSPKIG